MVKKKAIKKKVVKKKKAIKKKKVTHNNTITITHGEVTNKDWVVDFNDLESQNDFIISNNKPIQLPDEEN